jgi:ABC-type dipeptide/oligopeptide/nickel transport system ATPase subunit
MLNVINEKETLNLLDSVKYGVQGIKVLLDQKPALQGNLVEVENDIKAINSKLEFIATTKSYYVKAVDILYEESIGALKETLNAALKYIMFDKNYACNLILDDKRGTKTLEVTLVDLDDDFEVDLKDGVGQGVRTIISFILKAYYLINKESKLLFLDEKYSALSDHYVPRFFEFMKKMADERGMILVLITHDTRFAEYADKTYLVNDGHASLMENSETNDSEQE